jgi:hypothetical protein
MSKGSLLVKHWGGPGEVEVVVDVVDDLGWDGDWRVVFVKNLIKLVHVEGRAVALNLLPLLPFFLVFVLKRVKSSVFLINFYFMRLNFNQIKK